LSGEGLYRNNRGDFYYGIFKDQKFEGIGYSELY
jgi:hypothetical protein